MCSEYTKFRQKKKNARNCFRYLLLGVLYEKKKKPHNNKPQTINTDLCLCFDVMMMS